MASALMAFVKGLGTEKEEDKVPTNQAIPDEIDDEEEDMFEESGDESSPQKPPTLLEVAKKEGVSASPSLMDVAKSLEFEAAQQDNNSKPTLATLAAEINHEEREASETQTNKIRHALDATSAEVRAERIASRNEQVVHGLKAAVTEQQQQYDEEEFEDDAVSVREAAETLAASVAKAKSAGHCSPKKRRSKPLKGAISSQSLSKLELQRTMQDKLSAFQFQQLSITQRRLFLASLAHGGKGGSTSNNKPKKRVANREALNELAKDKFTQARQKQKHRHEFARLDDNRHCRFTPRLHNSSSKKKLPNNDSDEDEGPGGSRGAALRRNEDFVRRQEAAEKARREQLRRTREEAAYLDRVDKKECPSCGNPQSYSELTQKRKKCPNCGVTYKSRIAWSDVAKDFLDRMEEFQQHCKERQREQQEENERREALACRPENDENAKKTWEEVRDEFLGRLQLDLEYREMSKAAMWDEIERAYTFSPSISRRAQQLELGDFDERVRRDLDERRLRREQIAARTEAVRIREQDFERRNASVRTKKHYTPSAPFQERMHQDLAKRRDRERQRW
ncbi:Cleavage induced protein [Phytophthora megakarya]|uniref:Cleavage induced protein n=1 Tax=Phytophthora megakarya TaxID=4795 RepID=A0A225W4K5_9STRA|nr:Cleavage induced protein [Phytophthora megakarya]